MNALDRFERAIGGLFRKLAPAADRELTPLELRRQLLREIAAQVQPKGGGEFFFPHTSIQIEVLADSELHEQVLEGAFDGDEFANEVAAELERSGCPGSHPQVRVRVTRVSGPAEGDRFRISYSREEPAALQAAKPRPPAKLIVVKGQAGVKQFVIDQNTTNIGRMQEVVNSRTGLERYNHVAFDASETTVSRKHALVQYDPVSGGFRALNDPEGQARTSILRDGRVIVCDASRGVQLRSGDELILGTARIRFELL